MSALWLRFFTIICLPCVALSDPGASVEWKDLGELITIRCRSSFLNELSLNIKKGLHKHDIFSTGKTNPIVSKELSPRLSFDIDNFPSVDITIKNLSVEDTGPYWCLYSKIYEKDLVVQEGNGSLLLVVKELGREQCGPENIRLILWSALCFAFLMLAVVTGLCIWTIFKRKMRKAEQVSTNDVYEDMRGTLSRRGAAGERAA